MTSLFGPVCIAAQSGRNTDKANRSIPDVALPKTECKPIRHERRKGRAVILLLYQDSAVDRTTTNCAADGWKLLFIHINHRYGTSLWLIACPSSAACWLLFMGPDATRL